MTISSFLKGCWIKVFIYLFYCIYVFIYLHLCSLLSPMLQEKQFKQTKKVLISF